MPSIKFPHIKVKLAGRDGNAYAIMGRVSAALKKHNVPKSEIDKYLADSMSGDYNHLLHVATQTVQVS